MRKGIKTNRDSSDGGTGMAFASIKIPTLIIGIVNFIIFVCIFYFFQPSIISVNPVSINDSIAINDNFNKSLIKNIMIKNIGPETINLQSRLEINDIGYINNNSKTKFPNSYINISLNPDQPQQIKSGDAKFLSVFINASRAYLPGDYRGAIILSANGDRAKEIIRLNINITAAKSGNYGSQSVAMNKSENQAARGNLFKSN